MQFGESNNGTGSVVMGREHLDFLPSCLWNIKAVLSTQFDSFGKGPKFYSDWHEFLGEGIFNTDGQQWSDGRALVRAQFAKDRISDIDIFERHTLQLIPLLIGGETIDIKPLMFGFTLYMATDFLLGKSTGSIHDPDIVVFIISNPVFLAFVDLYYYV
ncbi:Cytochrome P450 52A3-B [Pseudocercospora fuligena]|uniref:Cytochrome P450 52A3-B n=1 Tax=Pseudocercospora fuligena TaxID=685502 RepID=A0A8H6VDF8_9PEZI|nr:Cytochrome P450 52A3-B [Pseudocercospora fuligena]